MSRQLFVVKVVLDDGQTKTIRCEPTTTIAEIKEQFSYRYNPQDHRICFADGRVGDETMAISAYRIEEGAILYLRNKQISVTHNVEPDDVRRPSWISNATGQPIVGMPSAPPPTSIPSAVVPSPLVAPTVSIPGGQLLNPNKEQEVLDIESETDSNVRKTKIKTFLSHFLRKRPNAEELLRAKIIEEAPQINLVQPTLAMVRQCCEWISQNAIDVEGIFRVSATKSENTVVADSLVAGVATFTKLPVSVVNVHSITTGLKIYIRERTYPLVPYKYYKNYLACLERINRSDEEAKRTLLQSLISALPANNQMIMLYLFKFLHDVANHSDKNKMTAHNLGVVFGPCIIRTTIKGMESLQECEAQVALAESLVLFSDRLSFGVQNPASTLSRTLCGSSKNVVDSSHAKKSYRSTCYSGSCLFNYKRTTSTPISSRTGKRKET